MVPYGLSPFKIQCYILISWDGILLCIWKCLFKKSTVGLFPEVSNVLSILIPVFIIYPKYFPYFVPFYFLYGAFY